MDKLLSSLTSIVVVIVLATVGCKKSDTPPPPEQDLIISTDAASYTIIPGPSMTFKLKIESAVPPSGVRIEYTVVSEIDNQNYPQGPPIYTYNPTSTISIAGLPEQKICICAIKVTSISKNTNTATTGFRVGYK
jgi:hypothetical protein